jgi:GH15 family glucan-1,4-alpha-glucosidase
MPRDIPVGNGKLLVCFDGDYRIRDLYYPHVGLENHVVGNRFRLGVFCEGTFSWVGEEWKRKLAYETDTLVTQVSLYNERLNLLITCRDAVDFHEDVYLREVTVENLHSTRRAVRLFFTQDFDIYGNSIGDTAVFSPDTGGILHYKDNRYFLANGRTAASDRLAAFATGLKNVAGREGAWRDAEDGTLSGNTVAQGSVDSVLALDLDLAPMSKGTAHYWLCAARDWTAATDLDAKVRARGVDRLIERTAYYWRLWLRKESPHLEHLPGKVRDLYRRSLLVMLTNTDQDGGIIAANDSDLIEFNRDTYSYIWGRDGALVARAYDMAGYPEPAQRFYAFASRAMKQQGYLLHKYNADGSLASSWHPWADEAGNPRLPIQEDETALVLWSLWNHFVLYRDIEYIKPLYRPVIKNAADFMVRHRHGPTGLPAPCYDLWEERWGISAFTVGAVFGGLTAASLFCTVFGQEEIAETYRQAATAIRDAASAHLWREDLGRFCRALVPSGPGGPAGPAGPGDSPGADELVPDPVPDSSVWGLAAFGMYTVQDGRISATMGHLRDKLWIGSGTGGMARFENDLYYRASPDAVGNPWPICTLWLADYLIDQASTEDELKAAVALLEWVADHALPSGILSEQIHPLTGQPLSASPLTWSHAAFVSTCLRALLRYGSLGLCPECATLGPHTSRIRDWLGQMYHQACDAIHGSCRIK